MISTAQRNTSFLETQQKYSDRFRTFEPWAWLIGATILLFFADGRNTVAAAAWLAPAAWLRFVRTQRPVPGLFVTYAVFVAAHGFAYHGMIPIPGIFYYIFLAISGVSAILPYLADRLLAPRLRGLPSTLIFPTGLVLTQFIYSHGPMGSWGSIPYTQADNLPLLQLLSVTGLWGITFLIGWFASTINAALNRTPSVRRTLKPLVIFAAVYSAVILLGGLRLALFPPRSPTVRVASLSPVKRRSNVPALLDKVITGKATHLEIAQFNRDTEANQQELLARSEREARSGARIIFWSETAAYVLKQNENALLARGQALAAKYHIYLGMTLGTWSPGAKRPLENKVVLIEPTGRIAWQYLKSRPTPGPEMALSVKSKGRPLLAYTSYGKMSAAICYDTDFPTWTKLIGRLPADLVLSPAGDWKAIDPRHTQIASFRAVEQGFNLVRQANLGLSAAYDYQGRRLASMDEYQAADLTLISQLPTQGVRTLYSRLGDWFAWLCIVIFLVLSVRAIRNHEGKHVA